MTINVTYDAEKLRKYFSQRRIPYNELRYPPTLLLTGSQEGTDAPRKYDVTDPWFTTLREQGKALGFVFVNPLGDMEDMVQLDWDKVQAAEDAALQKWVTGRYGVNKIWTAILQWPAASTPGGELSGQVLAWERSGKPQHYRTAQAIPPTPPPTKESREALYADLARRLLDDVMDHWIEEYAVQPVLKHAVPLHVVHGTRLSNYAAFFRRLQGLPGVTRVTPVLLQARGVLLEIDYQGKDTKLMEAVSQLEVDVVHEGDAFLVRIR
jgi:hypothetical protein